MKLHKLSYLIIDEQKGEVVARLAANSEQEASKLYDAYLAVHSTWSMSHSLVKEQSVPLITT